MTNYRIFLLSFLTVSWFFLSGLNKPDAADMSVLARQNTDEELESFETEHTLKLLETKQVKAKKNVKPVKSNKQDTQHAIIKTTNAGVADENNPIDGNELKKPLDLSVPFKGTENSDLKVELKTAEQSRETGLFDPQTKNKSRSLELNGDFVMSPEPEAEKRKSVDGAGIVIKLKP